MYWSEFSLVSSPKIEQANMDGSARTTLVSSGLREVTLLALDHQNRLLYWCDLLLGKIERVDLQGKNRVPILEFSMYELSPLGLAISGDVLYFSGYDSSVHQYNMKSSFHEVLVRGTGRPMQLHIYHQDTVNGKHITISLIFKKFYFFTKPQTKNGRKL